MELLIFTIQNDWPVLLPILLASIAVVGVSINRWQYYTKNRRDVVQFVHHLQRELQRSNLDNAQTLSSQLGGVMGEVCEEGVQILAAQPNSFSRSFDITIALALRKLEQMLNVLGTVGTIAPYLGLLGTVFRILLTFGELSEAGNNGSAEVMFGIGSALIATAFGLALAILAVTLNNYFRARVSQFEDDFQLLKLVFLSYTDEANASVANQQLANATQGRVGQQPPMGGLRPQMGA